MLDLLLINAPSRAGVYGELANLSAVEPPVWAGLIATYCKTRGFSVEILDAEAKDLTAGMTAAAIVEAAPRLVAFCIYGHQPSASTQCLSMASQVCREAKSLANDRSLYLPTLALGTHPSALPERTLREEPFDYVCQGEGPSQVVGLLRRLAGAVEEIPGLWWMLDKPTTHIPQAQNILDLDSELSRQAWELLDLKKYRAHNWHLWTAEHDRISVLNRSIDGSAKNIIHSAPLGGYASVQTSLGCQFACAFCCIQAPFGDAAPRMRYWSAANVVGQIARLVDDFGITNLKVPDEMFCFNRPHVKAICHGLIERGLGDRLNMWAYARVDTVKDEEMLALMRRAWFRWLGVGVESGSSHVRDGVEKGRFGNEDIKAALARVRNAGICVGANYIFGLPDDTRESCAETLALACELNTECVNFYCAMAYPGSALYRQAKEKKGRP